MVWTLITFGIAVVRPVEVRVRAAAARRRPAPRRHPGQHGRGRSRRAHEAARLLEEYKTTLAEVRERGRGDPRALAHGGRAWPRPRSSRRREQQADRVAHQGARADRPGHARGGARPEGPDGGAHRAGHREGHDARGSRRRTRSASSRRPWTNSRSMSSGWGPRVERGSRSQGLRTGALRRGASCGRCGCIAMEMLELPHDVTALALNLEEENVGVVLLGEDTLIKEGDLVKRTGRVLQVPVGEALVGRVVDPLGRPLDDKGPIETDAFRPVEFKAPGVVERQPVKEPLQTGIKAIDAMIPIGRGQREAHHRRPPDRQDGDHRRHDHQPEGPERDLRLRGHRPEGIDGHAGRAEARGVRRDGLHHHRRRHGLRVRPAEVPGALRGRCHGRVLPVQRQPRRVLLRRPVQTGRRLPPDVPAAAPAARPRSLPGRRLLPALAAAGARRQAQRRARRRISDRHPGHRDPGRRRVGVHPDQRHLHHRRADLPAERPLLLGRAAGRQHRHLGVAGRRQRADQGDEAGGGPPAHRPGAVPRVGGVRPVRFRAGRGDTEDAVARPRA